jgi:cytochrome c biogenesis protein ResB
MLNTMFDNNMSHPANKLFAVVVRKTYNFMSSTRLALVLLITILMCCVAGVTVISGEQAWSSIFNTLWFNCLLVLLVLNVAFCFFGRIWGRKVTMISLGMILFHVSFVAMLGGVIYNSLFYFRATIRLTEGETLLSSDLQSYDAFDHGRFFAFSKLKGETTLLKMHRDYSVDGADKQVAYEVAVGEGHSKIQGIIYVTHKLDHNGFDYFRDKEGYSLLIMLYNGLGKEIYGAHVPLQSLKQKDESFLYTTGSKERPGPIPFPQDPLKPLFGLQVAYRPSLLKGRERAGEAFYQVWKLQGKDSGPRGHTAAEGKAAIGNRVNVGSYYLEAKEVRYWVGMNVRYEPGKPIVLTSLWVGLGGMILTFIGRMRRSRFEEKVALT